VGSYGLRGEAAYVRTQDDDGRDFFTKNPYLYAVVGSDRTFGGNFNTNLQYVYRHAFDWRGLNQTADAGQRSVAEQVNILSFQQTEDFHGASFRMSHKSFNETLETELTLFGWIDNGLVRPKVTYAFSDHWRGILGGEIFAGEKNSFFGRLKETSSAFAEVRFLF
jgi:hypothetical protein